MNKIEHSLKLFFPLLLIIAQVSLVNSCQSSSGKKKFIYDLSQSIMDKNVTSDEFENLSTEIASLESAGVTVAGKIITSVEDLKEFFAERGIAYSVNGDDNYPDVKLEYIHVLLETSSSMRGYSNSGNPDFTAPILSLFNIVPEENITTAYIYEKIPKSSAVPVCVADTIDTEMFKTQLTNGRILEQKSSPLDQIIKAAIEKVSNTTVSCLITDGILSGTNAEIARDREFTNKNLPLLQQRIQKAVSKAKEDGYDFVAYQMTTPFTGVYFDYKNNHHRINNHSRPYYLIMFGKRTNLQAVHAELMNDSSFTPKNVMSSYSNSLIEPVSRGLIVPIPGATTAKVGYDVANQRVSVKKIKDSLPIPFKFRICLSQLPEEYQNDEFLLANLKMDYHDEVSGNTVNASDLIVDVKTQNRETSTYEITISVDIPFLNTIGRERLLHLWMPVANNEWYVELSESDDTVNPVSTDKTFGLNYFLGGFMRAYGSDTNTKAIDTYIIISK